MSGHEELVAALDALQVDDPEGAHADADALILAAMPEEVREAYDRVVARTRWWAFA